MKKDFSVLLCIFAISSGVIALSSLERKVGGVRKTTRYNHLLLMVKHPRLGRIATATPIGIYFAISAASCISKYEYKENFDEVFLFFRQYNFTVEAMASHPRYTGSRSHEFDIGFIQTKEPFELDKLNHFSSVTPVNVDDPLLLRGFAFETDISCLVPIKCITYCNTLRQDEPFNILPVEGTYAWFEDKDIGSPIFKNKNVVGLFSKDPTSLYQVIYCTWLGQKDIGEYILGVLQTQTLPPNIALTLK